MHISVPILYQLSLIYAMHSSVFMLTYQGLLLSFYCLLSAAQCSDDILVLKVGGLSFPFVHMTS